MKRIAMFIAFAALCVFAAQAQTGAGGSANANASVGGGQASAHTDASQQAQTPAGSASANASSDAQAQHEKLAREADKKQEHDHSANSAGNPGSAALSSGSTLQAELTKSVDAKKAKPGDEVTAKLTQDLKSDGKVVLHKGSKLVGHVTEAQAHSKEHSESKLGIVFDKAIPKGGGEVAFNGVIQAIAPPLQSSVAAGGDAMGGMSAPAGGGARSTSGGMLSGVGGVAGSTLGGATGAVGGTTSSVAGATGATANGTLGSATQGLGANGALTGASRGALSMPGVNLTSAASGATQASIISSADHTVKLDSGTQMVLQVTGAAAH